MDVRFEVGPIGAEPARVWVENSRKIVAAIRRRPAAVSFVVEDPLLDLVDMYLTIWSDVAEHARTFHWSSVVESEGVERIARQWRLIAALTPSELAELGCTWAPPAGAPFFDAVLRGVIGALEQDPRTLELASELAGQPPGGGGTGARSR